MIKITFGKHKGSEITDIPTEYLEWGSEKLESSKWREAFAAELKRRAKIDKEDKARLKANINDPSTLEFLVQKHITEIESEIANSDCSWEYDDYNVGKEAEERARIELAELQIEVAVENLKKEFEGKEELTLELLKKIESAHYNYGLERSQFSEDAKYQVACEYIQKLESIRGY